VGHRQTRIELKRAIGVSKRFVEASHFEEDCGVGGVDVRIVSVEVEGELAFGLGAFKFSDAGQSEAEVGVGVEVAGVDAGGVFVGGEAFVETAAGVEAGAEIVQQADGIGITFEACLASSNCSRL
jgi:hypothetical protein